MSEENKSEVARLRAEIDAHYYAAKQALDGPAEGVAKHKFINAKYARIGEIQEELGQLVGEEEAAKIVVEQMDKKEDKKQS